MLTRQDFAIVAAIIAKRAASWTHETVTMTGDSFTAEMPAEPALRFCRDIRELCARIEADVSNRAAPRDGK